VVGHPALLDPTLAAQQAPADFDVRFETTKGAFVVSIHRNWSPHGADRLFNLVQIGWFDDEAFFRAIDGFMVQFGLHGNPEVNNAWREANIPDDAVSQPNKRGRLSFATAGPNTRTTQLFINYVDNASKLDGMGFSPVGEVTEGMEVVDSLFKGYGEGAPRGKGPYQGRIHAEGNAYLKREFPKLDWIKTARLVEK
jgi:peptidyl-prolyl cis-trans isomerase A (cyclophilin A)